VKYKRHTKLVFVVVVPLRWWVRECVVYGCRIVGVFCIAGGQPASHKPQPSATQGSSAAHKLV
jgi:hypothetical protein